MENLRASDRLFQVRERIRSACDRAGRKESEVCLVAVSKTHPPAKIQDFIDLGVRDFGENYVQEALEKINVFSSPLDLCWHFIGNLQSNKAKLIPGKFAVFHGLDSFNLGKKLDGVCAEKGIVLNCLVQVNVDQESTKSGIEPSSLFSFLEKTNELKNLKISGLMCIPSSIPKNGQRAPFQYLRELMEESNRLGAHRETLKELSMGMSSDYEDAILEGATYLRLGTILFGKRGT